jgi:hypothetical protein
VAVLQGSAAYWAAGWVFGCVELTSLRYIDYVETGVVFKMRATEENSKKSGYYNGPW